MLLTHECQQGGFQISYHQARELDISQLIVERACGEHVAGEIHGQQCGTGWCVLNLDIDGVCWRVVCSYKPCDMNVHAVTQSPFIPNAREPLEAASISVTGASSALSGGADEQHA